MNCEQVKRLADLPRECRSAAQTALARDHARDCEACRGMLVADERLDAWLARLPEARLSESLAPSIMAGITRSRAAPREAAPSVVAERPWTSRWWAVAIGCVLALGAYLVALLTGDSVLTDFGRSSLDPQTSARWFDPFAVVAVAGALLCLVGIADLDDSASHIRRDQLDRE